MWFTQITAKGAEYAEKTNMHYVVHKNNRKGRKVGAEYAEKTNVPYVVHTNNRKGRRVSREN
jgi:hypothetical protein